MNARIVRSTLACSIALVVSAAACAESIRIYQAGDVPDPRVVARILGAKPARFASLPKTRGLFYTPDEPAAVEPEFKDAGHTVSEDEIAASASAAVSAWSAKLGQVAQRGSGGAMQKTAYALPSRADASRGEAVAASAYAQKTALQTESPRPAPAGKADALALAIKFANNSWQLNDASKRAIDSVAEGIKLAGFERKVVVEGHTNAAGSSARNLKLSRLRAEAVKRYLIASHAIPESALVAKGMGSAKPLPGTHPNSAYNRRVQFRALA